MSGNKLRRLETWLKYIHGVAGAVSLPNGGCDEENCKAQIAVGEIFNAVALAATGHTVDGPGPEYDDVGTERLIVYVNQIDDGSWLAHLIWVSLGIWLALLFWVSPCPVARSRYLGVSPGLARSTEVGVSNILARSCPLGVSQVLARSDVLGVSSFLALLPSISIIVYTHPIVNIFQSGRGKTPSPGRGYAYISRGR